MRARYLLTLLIPLALFATAVANAQTVRPEQPQVTLGADIKLLRFDWEPVAGAAYYQLRFRSSVGVAYQPLGERIPASVTQTEHAIPVHLQNWSGMRFAVAACNASGCTRSAALDPRPLMLDTIGYLKSSNSERFDCFGQSVALSADGFTLAVGSAFEDSNATGVNGDQANNDVQNSGAVYVFRRRGNTWHQEAYLKASTSQSNHGFGVAFEFDFAGTALSADGSILAVSAPRETVNGIEGAGAVYVFRRSNNAWGQVARLQAPEPMSEDFFGASLDMSRDGRTLKVMSTQPRDSRGTPARSTHIFVRPASTWQYAMTIPMFTAGDWCQSTRMSGDGQTLVLSCGLLGMGLGHISTMKRVGNTWVRVADLPTPFYEGRQPIGLNTDATVMSLVESRTPRLVGVYRWNGANWAREAGLPGPVSTDPFFIGYWGYNMAFDDAGELLALSDPQAREANAGISPTIMPGPADLGAVYLFQHDGNTNNWNLRNVVKSPRPGFRDVFGLNFALSGSGRTLAVGAPAENSDATGIDGDRNNENAQDSGAAYLY